MTSEEQMVLAYRAPDAPEAAMLVHVLESDGIPAKQVGGSLTIAFGDLGADALLTEVWVPSDRVAEARKSIETYYATQGSTETAATPWTCTKCGEKNDGGFGVCWSCQAELPG